MNHSTTNTYTLKRDILSFSNKISYGLSRPDRKFSADMTYGLLASGSCLLTDVVDQLHEKSKKINSVDRLSKHLAKGIPARMTKNYLRIVKQMTPASPVIHIDDSDVVKPDGYRFESLGYVRDGSESTKGKNVEKNFTSINDVTFAAIDRAAGLYGKATFAMDRGYDDNKIYNKLFSLSQEFVIRLTAKRKVLYHGKWIPVTELCNRRKGKVRMSLPYNGQSHDAYLSHVKVQITASRKSIYLVLVYGITDRPMMLATNKQILSKDDVIDVAKTYFSRWRIEEYFRSKKQLFAFENFRVRKLKAINALNFFPFRQHGFPCSHIIKA